MRDISQLPFKHKYDNNIIIKQRKKGVEPLAFALARQRSTTELLAPIKFLLEERVFCFVQQTRY